MVDQGKNMVQPCFYHGTTMVNHSFTMVNHIVTHTVEPYPKNMV